MKDSKIDLTDPSNKKKGLFYDTNANNVCYFQGNSNQMICKSLKDVNYKFEIPNKDDISSKNRKKLESRQRTIERNVEKRKLRSERRLEKQSKRSFEYQNSSSVGLKLIRSISISMVIFFALIFIGWFIVWVISIVDAPFINLIESSDLYWYHYFFMKYNPALLVLQPILWWYMSIIISSIISFIVLIVDYFAMD